MHVLLVCARLFHSYALRLAMTDSGVIVHMCDYDTLYDDSMTVALVMVVCVP